VRQLVWTPDGGTYMAVRLARMHLEFRDRVGLREQEAMVGRRRDSGAPLGGRDEFDDPRLGVDPAGEPMTDYITAVAAGISTSRPARGAPGTGSARV
jgi:deferrochelatase/peroxidase EfeB